ncbi:hypothetical protein B0H13DRAFT_2366007 [Mycena leptocephala]|nr:hypothetical protein B0H13DRAFT_2366007 [Mycena leptocephala]
MSQSPYETETERRRRLRREAQRERRSNLDDHEQELQRKRNTSARAENRAQLDEAQQAEIRQHNSEAHRLRRNTLSDSQRDAVRQTDRNAHQTRRSAPSAPDSRWWERIAVLNTSETSKPLSLRWNRVCKICGIKALTGERIHDECFPPLPPYPHEWDFFINNRKTSGISRKPNNIFSLTAIGVYDGDFMKFPDGIAAVTLAGGRTYHRMLPSHEGQHVIRWFIHDPWAMFIKGAEMEIPRSWIDSALAGLERVNPFIAELEKLNVYDDDDDMALHIEHFDSTTNEIAAVVSRPQRRHLHAANW